MVFIHDRTCTKLSLPKGETPEVMNVKCNGTYYMAYIDHSNKLYQCLYCELSKHWFNNALKNSSIQLSQQDKNNFAPCLEKEHYNGVLELCSLAEDGAPTFLWYGALLRVKCVWTLQRAPQQKAQGTKAIAVGTVDYFEACNRVSNA